MDRAVREWMSGHSDRLSLSVEVDTLVKRLNKSYTIYGKLLLLPSSILEHTELEKLRTQDEDGLLFLTLYEHIAKNLKITHIALNHPIPLYSGRVDGGENIVRSPTHFEPVFGDFGPATSNDPPDLSDLNAAFWVTAKQNGVLQTWAPRWTMFSRGNVKEKARILSLPSVKAAVDEGREDSRGCSAVDLYAGIGYFAFSYVKAGVQNVICWDLNPWSCEGLLRGAKANKWIAARVTNDEGALTTAKRNSAELIVFNESNDQALRRLIHIRSELPPVRHVNCGLLPSSASSWDTAVRALDPELGGWLHIHENFATIEIEEKAEEVRRTIERLAASVLNQRQVRLEHIERVKTYAPGVWHCVLDIHIMSHHPA